MRRGPLGTIRNDGRCPHAECFNTGTPATHCGLCAECFARLTADQRRDLIDAEKARNPPPTVENTHTTVYVPTPRLRVAVALAAVAGAAAGGGAAFALLRTTGH